jgi:hypothetical protein
MQGRDIKEGMKVVPVIKTIDGPLSKSAEWRRALAVKQEYLYVIKLDNARKSFTCAADKTAKTGDKFAAIDLRDAATWKGWNSRAPGFEHTPIAKLNAERARVKAAKAREQDAARRERDKVKAAKAKERDAKAREQAKARDAKAKAQAAKVAKVAKAAKAPKAPSKPRVQLNLPGIGAPETDDVE